MNHFASALWAETLKMRRSKVPFFTAIGFSIAPLAGGLFMIILKDPAAAKSFGLITAKAQLLTGTADWPAFFGFLSQSVAAGGMILFAMITIWVFGREFSDHTVKQKARKFPYRSKISNEINFYYATTNEFLANSLKPFQSNHSKPETPT